MTHLTLEAIKRAHIATMRAGPPAYLQFFEASEPHLAQYVRSMAYVIGEYLRNEGVRRAMIEQVTEDVQLCGGTIIRSMRLAYCIGLHKTRSRGLASMGDQ